MKNIYFLTLLSSSFLILTMGITLLCYQIEKQEKLKNYNIARRLLAIAFLVLGGFGLLELWSTSDTPGNYIHPFAVSVTLSMGFIQSLLFTFSFITLVNSRFFFIKKIIPFLIFNLLLNILLFVGMNTSFFDVVVYICIGCYYFLLAGYVYLFEKEYRLFRMRRDDYFPDDKSTRRLRWIRKLFYLSLAIGILVYISFSLPENLYPLYIIIYTVFYIYFAIKYLNYPVVFLQLYPILEEEEVKEPPLPVQLDKLPIEEGVQQWIERKGFVNHEITLESLAQELCTNRTYLSSYINQKKGCNFRHWISELRIEESKRILLSNPDISICEVHNMVGITDRSSFYRQFLNIIGEPPSAYKNR